MSLWGCDCPFPALAACHQRGMVCSQLVLFSPLLCAWAWWCLRAFHVVAIPQSGLLAQVSSLRLPSGHSGPVLTLSNAARASLSSPHLLVADPSVWATSPLGVMVRCLICEFYLFFFLLPVMFASEIPKLPTDPPVRGFPGVWKLLFHDSLPGMGLCP